MKRVPWIPVAAAVVFGAATAAASPPPSPDRLSPISAYAGTWRAEIQQLDTDFSKAGRSGNVIHNDCWRATLFYACAQTVNGVPGALVVYTWDDKDKVYATYAVPSDGGQASKGKLVIEGDTWFFPWDQPDKAGPTLHFRVVNHFVDRDNIEFRQEFSRDGIAWTVIQRGLERRQGPTPAAGT